MATTEPRYADGQYVVFRMENEHYGIAIGAVEEIIVLQDLTRFPQMPEFMEGMLNLRGRIIPVINLRKRFGLPSREAQNTGRTVVAEVGGMEAGLLVDDVIGVQRLSAGSIQAPPNVLSAGAAVVQGVAQVDDRLVLILDPDLILVQSEQAMLLERTQPSVAMAN